MLLNIITHLFVAYLNSDVSKLLLQHKKTMYFSVPQYILTGPLNKLVTPFVNPVQNRSPEFATFRGRKRRLNGSVDQARLRG